MRVKLLKGDIPPADYEAIVEAGLVAWDIETTGLDWRKERIAMCQLYSPGQVPVVIRIGDVIPENLKQLLQEDTVTKIFHHAMFDVRFMAHSWACQPQNVVCTKVASKVLKAPASGGHRLNELVQEVLGVTLEKGLSKSNWLASELTAEQLDYAVKDVLYLPSLFERLSEALRESGRLEWAARSYEYIPTRVALELVGGGDVFTY